MKDILRQIFALFTTGKGITFQVKETYNQVSAKLICHNGKNSVKQEFIEAIQSLNSRDSIHISILKDEKVLENYDTKGNTSLDDFIKSTSSVINEGDFDVILTIAKKNIDKIISVYYIDDFIEYLSDLSIEYFFEAIINSLKGNDILIYEIQDEEFQEYKSNSIGFLPKNGSPSLINNINRLERIQKTNNLCHSNILIKFSLAPDDFFFQKHGNKIKLDNLFKKYNQILSIIFLFDIVEINKSTITFKLNGYKSLSNTIDTIKQPITLESFEQYFLIYSWVYEKGNITDKIGLARNLLSLNLDVESLKINDSTYIAIISNYKIYIQENVKQYFEIRNKISDQLIEMQNKADQIVDSFINDYKKSIFVFVSFFVSVIVIRVVSNGEFLSGFSTEVTFLSIAFLLISLLIMWYAIWEINKQIERYHVFYENLKERYEDLLDKTDINRILNNNKDFNANVAFIKSKRDTYTKIWIITVLILLITVIILFLINGIRDILNQINIITQIILLCFTKNI